MSKKTKFVVEVFCDTWGQVLNDLSRLTKESDAAANGRQAAERQAYMSLPRPGVNLALHSYLKPYGASSRAHPSPLFRHLTTSGYQPLSGSTPSLLEGYHQIPHFKRSNNNLAPAALSHSTIHSQARIRPPGLICSSLSNLHLAGFRPNLLQEEEASDGSNQDLSARERENLLKPARVIPVVLAPPKPLLRTIPVKKRSFESQEVHTHFMNDRSECDDEDDAEETTTTSGSVGCDAVSEARKSGFTPVVVRQSADGHAAPLSPSSADYRAEEKRQFEYRMSLIMDSLQEDVEQRSPEA